MPKQYPLNTLYLYLTKGCNMRCRHCWVNPGFQTKETNYPSLPIDLFHQIIEEALPLGLNSIKLTGGEPLLHPDIEKIIDSIKEKKLLLSIETNGTLCTPEIARKLAAAKARVSVSIDGPNAAVHELMRGVPGSFEQALAGIKNLSAAGLRPQIIMALVRSNIPYIKETIALAESLGAASIKFNPVHPIARGDKLIAEGEIISAKESLTTGQWIEESLSKSFRIRLIYSFPFAFRSLSNLYEPGKIGSSRCNIFSILGVLGDGSYALCGIGEIIPELVFGNAREHRLKDIWQYAPALLKIRSDIPGKLKGVCGQCAMRDQCLGCCVAFSYLVSRDLTSPYSMCQEAYDQGFFPKSRLIPLTVGSPVTG